MTKKSSGVRDMIIGFPSLLSTETGTISPLFAGSNTSGDPDGWNYERLLIEIVKWYERTDIEYGKAVRRRPEKISCDTCTQTSPGCCNQKVMTSLFEILPIAAFLQANNLDTPELRERLRVEGTAMEGTDREDWFYEIRPCAFLKDGRCSIYRVRPVACRSYYVITPSEDCQATNPTHRIAHIDSGKYLEMALEKAMAVHKALGLKETTQRILVGTLPRMVLLGLEMMEQDDYQGFVRAQSWPNEDNLDEWIEKGINPYREKLYQIRSKQRSTTDGSAQ
jgi:Fe-S-cluster containining protein